MEDNLQFNFSSGIEQGTRRVRHRAMCEFQGVSREEWNIADFIDKQRKSLLENPLSTRDILRRMKSESDSAALEGHVRLTWQDSCERRGYARVVCQVSLSGDLFDQFFNGRTGYRAHYYSSPDCGAAYNRSVIESLLCAVKIAYAKQEFHEPFKTVERSCLGGWSKIWVVGDGAAFDVAPNGLQARRWIEYWKNRKSERGLKIPLPPSPQLDFKGTFINSSTGDEWVDPLKIQRSIDIYESGWT